MSNTLATTFAYKWGQTVAFDLVVEAGTVPVNTTVECDIKAAESNRIVPDHSKSAIVQATVSFVDASGEDLAYWRCSLTPEQVKDLDPSTIYVTDVRILFDDTSDVYYPDPLAIDISKVVTVRPAL